MLKSIGVFGIQRIQYNFVELLLVCNILCTHLHTYVHMYKHTYQKEMQVLQLIALQEFSVKTILCSSRQHM